MYLLRDLVCIVPDQFKINRKSQLPATAKLSPGMGTGRDADESMNKSS